MAVQCGRVPPPEAPRASAAARRPNIVLILADDLGYGDIGPYGQRRIRTPHLDRLAREGVRFTSFYAGAPVCAPSRNVLMTGQHTGHVLIRGNAKIDLRPEDVTLGEVLQQAGYATGLVGKWGLGAEKTTGAPTRQGFESFFGYVDQTHAHNYYPSFLVRGEERVPLRNVVPNEGPYGQGVATKRLDYAPDLLIDEAVRFVEANHKRPFLLVYTPTLPHANNEAGANGLEIPDLGAYAAEDWPPHARALAAMITRLDGEVGRLLTALDRFGVASDTLVIFSSDNGPHREGGNDPEFFRSSGPFRGRKRSLYEGGIRVPFLARWPGHTPAGVESSHVGSFADVLPTLADLAGVAPPAGLDGLSFAPTLRGRTEEQRVHDALYWEFYEVPSQAVRLGQWKAVRQPMFSGPVELYDLEADPGETRDVAALHRDVVEWAREVMAKEHVPSPLWGPAGH